MSVARELFYWRGIRATGVDRVASEAGVASTTLYRLFSSKDDLVAAYVEREGARFREWFDAAANGGGADPRDQILAVFDQLEEQVRPEICRGCPFLMALAEVPSPDLGAHESAVGVKAWVRRRFGEMTAEMAKQGSVDDSEALADHLALIMDGVYASVLALGADGPANRALVLVELLLPRPSS